jgi:hypothetical protein
MGTCRTLLSPGRSHRQAARSLVRAAECNRLGMVIDCAHATFETTAGVLEASRQPVMVAPAIWTIPAAAIRGCSARRTPAR